MMCVLVQVIKLHHYLGVDIYLHMLQQDKFVTLRSLISSDQEMVDPKSEADCLALE